MKYITVVTSPDERVLHSYLNRNFSALVKRTIGLATSYIPAKKISEEFLPYFLSFCRHTAEDSLKIKIKRAKVPQLENLGTYETAKMLFFNDLLITKGGE